MSRIVIDARQYTTSTGRYAFRLLQYLDKLDTPHDFLVLLKPEDMAVYDYVNPRIRKVACPHKEFSFDEQLGLLRQIQSLRPDLVHFAIVQQPILYRGKKVTTMHDLTTARFINPDKKRAVYLIKQQVFKFIVWNTAHTSDAILTPSRFVADDVANFTHIHPDKITVSYEAADAIQDPPAPLNNLQNIQYIMYIGRPTPHKNLERLIQSFATLRNRFPHLHLVLAGKKDANYARIESLVPAALKPFIVFTGFVDDGQLKWLYQNCSAYIFPSLSEGFGLPGLEAMAEGAPVVSSSATCLPEIYGDAAVYFNPTDEAEMVEAITRVLSDESLRNSLRKAGLMRVQKYSWQRMAEQTLAVYNSVLSA